LREVKAKRAAFLRSKTTTFLFAKREVFQPSYPRLLVHYRWQ
jgi:hypothetical protein